MPNKRGKIKRARHDTIPEQKMVMRFVDLKRETADREKQTVEVVVATENPVERYDFMRDAIVNEVLAMQGVEFRGGRPQLPIVDSHDRSTVRNIYGSVRNLHVEGDELVGEASFARDEESQIAFGKLMDGHLSDFSVTATPKEIRFVEQGQSYQTARGDVVEGPADIVTKWMPTDASLVAAGADERSTVRRSYTDLPTETERMDEATLKPLQEKGMPEDIVDPKAALSWAAENLSAQPTEQAGEPEQAQEPVNETTDATTETEEETMADVTSAADAGVASEQDTEAAVDRALKADQQRRREIVAACQKVGIERAFADQLCDAGASVEVANKKIIERISNDAVGTTVEANVRVTENSSDKLEAAVRDGLVMRAMSAVKPGKKLFGEDGPAQGAEQFRQMSLQRMAEEVLRQGGIPVQRMNNKDIAMVAMGHGPTMHRLQIRRDGEAYHVTGMFPNLLLDAANKTLLAGYEEAPFTWSLWARQAPSVADFKNINRMRFSESPDLENVPENHDYPEKTMSDNKESYNVEKYGAMFSVSWETVVNDDLDAISRTPQMHGVAARRVQNKKVYEILTANDNMSDGNALFDTSNHSNDASSTGAPSKSTLDSAFESMMKQTGLSSDAILNLQPRYLIVPAALSATALELVGSLADPNAGGSNAGNSNTLNAYGPNGARPLQTVVEPQLDGNSSTGWYMAADTSQVDTVELSFLQGEESPVLENEWNYKNDSFTYKIRQTFGTKAIDWRGLYRNTG